MERSHVIAALGVRSGRGTVRFSLGRSTSKRDIERLLALLSTIRRASA